MIKEEESNNNSRKEITVNVTKFLSNGIIELSFSELIKPQNLTDKFKA